ncbi:hypothetical protein P171DRAFT_137260 [Karstenula rhodostoma CBS 690.94]|uniref:Uncharacterized protein n=1 Tax=Karstenula rhodostoma CBS 690.94 TaxID=1392251 RepID=A0A9P4PWU9_9PLEO|nr:hypothetical protein P171DRAFT_137260 [Karstenula rhodostoma CBS 690.94]
MREGQYLFGQWSDDLHLGLLWSQAHPFPSSTKTPTWPQIPSWFWASLNAPVAWSEEYQPSDRHTNPRQLCKSIKPMTQPDSHATTLVGNLMRLRDDVQHQETRLISKAAGRIEIYSGALGRCDFEVDQWYFDSLEGKDDETKTRSMLRTVFVIPLFHRDSQLVTCLVLLPLPTSGRGVFRRVGILHIHIISGRLRSDFTPMAQEYQKDITENFYQDCDGEGFYKISIV